MVNPISRQELSRFRQRVAQLVEKLKTLALRAGHEDALFRGVPAQVYRTCGKEKCRCMRGGPRHGPYKVIQVWQDRRSRQITLRRGEEHFFEMAQHYQMQQRNREEIKQVQEELLRAVDAMLERRTIWEKH